MIVSASDFLTGELKISQNQYSSVDLADFLADEKQEATIKKVLGFDLGQLFIDDLDTDGVPTLQIYKDINDPVVFESGGRAVNSEGLKAIVKKLLYSDYVRQQSVINQSGGNGSIQQEATTPDVHLKAVVIYNRAVEDIWALRTYINSKDDYPTFSGEYFEYDTLI